MQNITDLIMDHHHRQPHMILNAKRRGAQYATFGGGGNCFYWLHQPLIIAHFNLLPSLSFLSWCAVVVTISQWALGIYMGETQIQLVRSKPISVQAIFVFLCVSFVFLCVSFIFLCVSFVFLCIFVGEDFSWWWGVSQFPSRPSLYSGSGGLRLLFTTTSRLGCLHFWWGTKRLCKCWFVLKEVQELRRTVSWAQVCLSYIDIELIISFLLSAAPIYNLVIWDAYTFGEEQNTYVKIGLY